jgi:hypothetical protein
MRWTEDSDDLPSSLQKFTKRQVNMKGILPSKTSTLISKLNIGKSHPKSTEQWKDSTSRLFCQKICLGNFFAFFPASGFVSYLYAKNKKIF